MRALHVSERRERAVHPFGMERNWVVGRLLAQAKTLPCGPFFLSFLFSFFCFLFSFVIFFKTTSNQIKQKPIVF
jgi:hypothetical protein